MSNLNIENFFCREFLATSALNTSQIARDNAFEDSALFHKYKDFADDMKYWGYTWEPIEVKTDDGWTLTTFRVTGKNGEEEAPERDESLNPVLMMHGQGCDATTWVWPDPDIVDKPLPLMLFDHGFDIYMASNRGTKYCQEHDTLKIDTPEYWAFSWAEMGLYDDVANVKMVRDRTGKKVSYVGVSQGTV